MEKTGCSCLRLQVRGRLVQVHSVQHTSFDAMNPAYIVCHLQLDVPEISRQAAVLEAGTHNMLCVLLLHVQAAV